MTGAAARCTPPRRCAGSPSAGVERGQGPALPPVGHNGAVSSLANTLLDVPPWLALLLVFALPALEASAFVGFLFPGEVATILGGVLAAEGRIPLWAAVAVAIAGAVVGDSVGYLVGARLGQPLLRRLPPRLVKPEHVERTTATIRRLGGRAVFVGRFTAALRVLVPGLCGMSRMRYRTFLVWNVAGGVVWAGGSVVLGYLVGASWQRLIDAFSLGGKIAAGVVVGVAVLAWLVRRRRRVTLRRSRQGDPGSPPALSGAANAAAPPVTNARPGDPSA